MESYDVRLKDQQVIVVANGIEYRGRLVAITEDEVSLMTELGYVNLPNDRVSTIRGADEKTIQEPADVDESYFDDDADPGQ